MRFAPALIVLQREEVSFAGLDNRFALACERVKSGCHHDGHPVPLSAAISPGLSRSFAGKTGGGLTSLPADEKTLSGALSALQAGGDVCLSERGYVFVLEDSPTRGP